MLMTVEAAKKRISFGKMEDEEIKGMLEGVESVIREYTHNNFQFRDVRTTASSVDMELYGNFDHFRVGDTIQISQSVNRGVCVIKEVGEDTVTLDLETPLLSVSSNLVTLVRYPKAVISCATKLLKWEMSNGDKVGIKSETLSRHSTTYEDSSSLFMGYPVGILAGLNLFKKARF